MRKSSIYFFVILLLFVVGTFSVWTFGNRSNIPEAPKGDFSSIIEDDATFKLAVETIRGGNYSGGRELLEGNIANVSPAIEGVYKLWIASTFRFEDQKRFATQMTEVATGPLYGYRTRLYAYAFLGDLYSSAPGKEVLNEIVESEKLKGFQVLNQDATINYRSTFVALLQNATATLGDNPLVLLRTASIAFGAIRGGSTNPHPLTADQIEDLVARALPLENDLLQPDTTPLYASYTFLLAQVVGWLQAGDSPVTNEQVAALSVDQLYERAINLASSANKSVEASARINYVTYLIESHEKKTLEEQTKEQVVLLEKINTAMQPFEGDEKLQDSVIIQFYASAQDRNDTVSSELVKKIASYSPVFLKLVAEGR